MFLSIELVRVAGINGRYSLALDLECLCALLAEVFFENNGIPSIGSEERICNVSKERHQSDCKVQNDVEHHFRFDIIRQSSFNLIAGSKDHHCHERIKDVPNTISTLA